MEETGVAGKMVDVRETSGDKAKSSDKEPEAGNVEKLAKVCDLRLEKMKVV